MRFRGFLQEAATDQHLILFRFKVSPTVTRAMRPLKLSKLLRRVRILRADANIQALETSSKSPVSSRVQQLDRLMLRLLNILILSWES